MNTTDEGKWRDIYRILFPDDNMGAIPSPCESLHTSTILNELARSDLRHPLTHSKIMKTSVPYTERTHPDPTRPQTSLPSLAESSPVSCATNSKFSFNLSFRTLRRESGQGSKTSCSVSSHDSLRSMNSRRWTRKPLEKASLLVLWTHRHWEERWRRRNSSQCNHRYRPLLIRR